MDHQLLSVSDGAHILRGDNNSGHCCTWHTQQLLELSNCIKTSPTQARFLDMLRSRQWHWCLSTQPGCTCNLATPK
eukprot:4600345-Karenia_brevis.AAC.1